VVLEMTEAGDTRFYIFVPTRFVKSWIKWQDSIRHGRKNETQPIMSPTEQKKIVCQISYEDTNRCDSGLGINYVATESVIMASKKVSI
jgi:hypothetical protein